MGADIALTLISIPALLIVSCVCYICVKLCFIKPRREVTGTIHGNITDLEVSDQSTAEGEGVSISSSGSQLPTYSDLFPSLTAEDDKS